MILAKFFRYALSLSKKFTSKNQFASAKLLLFYIYKLKYKCEKCSLFECFANAISLRLNKILFASFKNFIIVVACHVICAN